MKSFFLYLGLAWVLAAGGPARPASASDLVKIRGNRVIIDEVYLAILDLPADARADPATARRVERSLLDFLHRAGYSLASAEARVVDDRIVVQLDEGHLEKVVFLGAGTLKTLRLKLDLTLPHHVFNRPNLVRQLSYLGKRHGVEDITFKLVPAREVAHQGPQLKDLGTISGHAIIRPGADYELHIHLGHAGWGSGFGLDLQYDFPDGFVAGGHYRGSALLFDGDRWKVRALAGAKFRKELDGDQESYLALSRATAEARWYTPPLAGRGLRPYLGIRSDLHSRQRSDLEVEIYYSERLEGSLNLGYEFDPGITISSGVGVQEKIIFGVESAGSDSLLRETSRLRPFVAAEADFVFDAGRLRRDRSHRLKVEGRHYWIEDQDTLGSIGVRYRKVFGFGWHDLEVGGRGAWLWGDILPDDEEPVGGRYLRGVFGGRWVHRVAGVSAEFRLSLVRDLYKLSLFHDLSVFGELDRDSTGQTLRVANSFGPGFHALILDTFQLNLYLGFGFSSGGDFDYGLAANLEKVF